VPERALLDAVLPLAAADSLRAQILFRSLETFFEPLGTCYVVAPDHDALAVRAAVPDGRYVVLRDSEVVPEIGYFRTTARLRAKLHVVGPPFHGWFVQQLVKLVIADRVATPFYLTLDADVICVRPTRYDDLVADGRALVQTTPPNHPEWNDDAERVLGLPRSGRQYAVTPAVLSVDGVRKLADHLQRRVRRRLRRFVSWRSYLLRNLPWTEYALYHTFLERTGLFDRYHVHGGPDAIYSNCVWMESEFDDWNPAADFPGETFRFSVVQSATRIPPERVWVKVAAALSSDGSSHARSLPSTL
jgi:Family of unknown function (DUF6492)